METNNQNTSSRSLLKWHAIGIGLKLTLLFGLVASVIGYVVFQSFLRQLRCEPIDATILTAKLEPCPDGMFSVDIRFAYTIERQRFTTGKYRDDFGTMCLKKDEAEEIINQYPQGRQVQAWYDPEHPKYAVLDRSLGMVHKCYLIVMGGFAVILTLAWLFRRTNVPVSERLTACFWIAFGTMVSALVGAVQTGCDVVPPPEVRTTGGDYGSVTSEILSGAVFTSRTGRDRSYDDLQWVFHEETFSITAGKNGLPPVLANRLLPDGVTATEITGKWVVADDVITCTEIKADGEITDQPPRTLRTFITPILRIEAGQQYKFARTFP